MSSISNILRSASVPAIKDCDKEELSKKSDMKKSASSWDLKSLVQSLFEEDDDERIFPDKRLSPEPTAFGQSFPIISTVLGASAQNCNSVAQSSFTATNATNEDMSVQIPQENTENNLNEEVHVVKKFLFTDTSEQDPSPTSFLCTPSAYEDSYFELVEKDPYSKKRSLNYQDY